MTQQNRKPWPRDLKLFALFSALWAAAITIRILLADYSDFGVNADLQAIIGGMKFLGTAARVVLLAQATIFAAFAVGVATERKWGLVLALFYLAETIISHLIYMMAYMDTFGESAHLRTAAAEGVFAVLVLLYLWIRSRDLLFNGNG